MISQADLLREKPTKEQILLNHIWIIDQKIEHYRNPKNGAFLHNPERSEFIESLHHRRALKVNELSAV